MAKIKPSLPAVPVSRAITTTLMSTGEGSLALRRIGSVSDGASALDDDVRPGNSLTTEIKTAFGDVLIARAGHPPAHGDAGRRRAETGLDEGNAGPRRSGPRVSAVNRFLTTVRAA